MHNKFKNYLIFYLFKITKHGDFMGQGKIESHKDYCEVFEKITKPSFEKNLSDLDEIVVFKDEKENIHDAFKDGFFRIYDLWKSEPCNIMFCGVDTYCQHPVEIFNKFDHFMMFNYTSYTPPDNEGKVSGFGFDHYFNCDVRYYPHSMKQETWEEAFEYSEPWEYEWNFEQRLYNRMLWSQGLVQDLCLLQYLV